LEEILIKKENSRTLSKTKHNMHDNKKIQVNEQIQIPIIDKSRIIKRIQD
jgi:hypothetical protein